MTKYDSTETTAKHIERVANLMSDFATMINARGLGHDLSKYNLIEKGSLDEMARLVAEEGNVPYGSDEYKRRTKLLGPMLEHHYASNSHHPEHYQDGVDGMNLLDIVEMFIDWKAASELGEEPAMNITAACDRFSVCPQLQSIFENTATEFGWKRT